MKTGVLLGILAAASVAGGMRIEPVYTKALAHATPEFEITAAGIRAPGVVGRVVAPAQRQQRQQRQSTTTEYSGRFMFTRLSYNENYGGLGSRNRRGRRGGEGCQGSRPCWAHDFPYTERNIAEILSALTFVRPHFESRNVVSLDDDRIFQFPILYMAEPGPWMDFGNDEVETLRAYLLRGGFMIVDDFQSYPGMQSLVELMREALPEYTFQPLARDHSIFRSFFEIDPVALQFPGFYRGDHITFSGIFEDDDPRKRLIVLAAENGDLGEMWEYSDSGFFPVDFYNDAYRVGINFIVYAMTH